LADRIGVIGPSKYLECWLRSVARGTGCGDKIVSFRSASKGVRKPTDPPVYTPEEFEAEHIRIAKEQVEQNGAQLILCSCTYHNIGFPPGARERMEKALGGEVIVITDPFAIGLRTIETLINLKLSQSKIQYPQAIIEEMPKFI